MHCLAGWPVVARKMNGKQSRTKNKKTIQSQWNEKQKLAVENIMPSSYRTWATLNECDEYVYYI